MSIIPRNYELSFDVDLTRFIFTGTEVLTFDVEDTVDEIVLDCKGLQVLSCTLSDTASEVPFKIDDTKGQLIITLPHEIDGGAETLIITFSGVFSEDLSGWYKSVYEIDGTKNYLVSTQFEPADARRVFPCIDHPSYKATFDISITTGRRFSVISNTDIKEVEELPDDRKKVMFVRTPEMSTYLLYLGVGDFEFQEDSYKNVKLRALTTSGKKKHTLFALDCAKKSLEYFEDYFGVPYPLPKLDLIAIPDFAVGAMENWGAITFRENAMLIYEGTSSVATRQRVAEVVAHEVAHQWFGNLVTMKWWDDLWLNESFATFMAYKVVNRYWPEWKSWTEYVIDTIFGAMSLDSLQSSHPIQVIVNNVEEINELFDEIAYDKGGSILRMLEGYLGEDMFRQGLRKYITRFQYKNAEGKNLWSTLEEVSEKPITSIMESYITQTGFPQIDVRKTEEGLLLKQHRFSFFNIASPARWSVPLVLVEGSSKKQYVLTKSEMTIPLTDKNGFVYVNPDYSGFYITSYDETLLESIGWNINTLDTIDRMDVVHDLFYLSQADRFPLNQMMNFISRYMSSETAPEVLMYIISVLSHIHILLQKEDILVALEDFSKRAMKQVGYEPVSGEPALYALLRSTALIGLALADNTEVLNFAKDKFNQYLQTPGSLHPDLRSAVYAIAVRSDDGNYEKVRQLYKKTDIQEEAAKLLASLSFSKNPDLVKKTLDMGLSPEIRTAQMVYVVSYINKNPQAKDIVFPWLMAHWDDLMKLGESLAMLVRRMLKVMVPEWGIPRKDEVIVFLKSKKTKSLGKTIDQVLEELEVQARFVEKNTHATSHTGL